jgi:hypothetical protein
MHVGSALAAADTAAVEDVGEMSKVLVMIEDIDQD